MSAVRFALLTGLAALTACQDSTGPGTPDYSGTWVADSIDCWNTFDTHSEIVPLGASLTLILEPDSTIGGHLVIPVDWMPESLPAEDDTLTGIWQATASGFHVYGPWSSLLTSVDFTATADTARAVITVKGWPLDPFSYRVRLRRQ
jgi:hypothetical protein